MLPTLTEIYERYSDAVVSCGSDKGTLHSYLGIYEELLAPKRTCGRVVEVGVLAGMSLRMWRDYFPLAEIIGIDITDVPPPTGARIRIVQGNSRDAATWRGIQDVDVLIDDGDHSLSSQIATLQVAWPSLSPDGLYAIEDVQNLDTDRDVLCSLHPSTQVYDLRAVKSRHDDVLVAFNALPAIS